MSQKRGGPGGAGLAKKPKTEEEEDTPTFEDQLALMEDDEDFPMDEDKPQVKGKLDGWLNICIGFVPLTLTLLLVPLTLY